MTPEETLGAIRQQIPLEKRDAPSLPRAVEELRMERDAAEASNQTLREGWADSLGRTAQFVAAQDDQAQQIAALRAELEAAKDIIRRDADFQEWAQGHLDSGRWAGHDRADAVKTELLEAETQLTALQAELAAEREKHDEEAYNDMKAAKEALQAEQAQWQRKVTRLIARWQGAVALLRSDCYEHRVLTDCVRELAALTAQQENPK